MITLDILATSTASTITQRVGVSWEWYVIRAAGFTAAGLLILLMLSGIGQVTGLTYRFIEPIKAWAIHKAMALALCASIAVHVGFLLIDHFITFSPVQVLVPFLSQYSNGTRLFGLPFGGIAVAFGILAMYGVAIIVLSSLQWIDTKKRTWHWLHYISYAVMFAVFLHALYVGSDLKYGGFRAAWIFAGAVVAVGVVMRLLRSGTLKK
ncbi:MAG TPA: ferric reductase-like transmembrane domain-containing protein [Candidatus Saccharimonadales bacterium]|nr:ferric reductase-like transmembrane domain-containing protein [Candidatus Saccharimonadales bacterium]